MTDPEHPITRSLRVLQRGSIAWVRRYHRLTVDGVLEAPTEPTLFVANHGFGGIVDLNVFAALAALDEMALDRPVTILTHQIAWTLGVGSFLEPLGAVPAGCDAAADALAAGKHVLVFPGGDLDAFKAHADKDRIVFGGRAGFARLAQHLGVPIVPLVTTGAGNTLFVVSDGQPLAKALRLDKLLRLKAMPVSVSIPWGVNVGLVGLLPYLPLPARLATRVLDPVTPTDHGDATALADHVTEVMQQALIDLAGQVTR